MTADSESCEVYHVSAMCLSAVTPIQSTPGEEPPSPSGCEDVTHLQPQWPASLLTVHTAENKQTNKQNSKKKPTHRIKSKACSRKHINKYSRHADILTVSSKVISGPALVRPFSAYFGRV